jgi:alpha-L-fucosidase
MTTALTLALLAAFSQVTYEPTWESLDARPNPQWFEDAKFGIFIHWGVYSVPSWGPKDRYSEWYWHDMMDKKGETWAFHEKTYGEKFQYQDFAPMFKAEMYDPELWADIFKRSGAKYVVLTSKHHEGFSLWPDDSNWNWNARDIGPHRDLLGDLTEAVRAAGLRMGYYYSLYEWFNPIYKSDVQRYVDEYMIPQLKGLVEKYKPDLVWPDGEWDHPDTTWRSTEFLAWLFNESSAPKDVAINDRWGKGTRSVHGGFATPEYQHRPTGPLMEKGLFEECQGMGKSFGYNRNENADNYRSAADLLHLLIDTVSRGGNLLLDIGPTADGRIPEIMQQRLLEMGVWLDVNGEAIYETTNWADAPEMDKVRFTQKTTLYMLSAWNGQVQNWCCPM